MGIALLSILVSVCRLHMNENHHTIRSAQRNRRVSRRFLPRTRKSRAAKESRRPDAFQASACASKRTKSLFSSFNAYANALYRKKERHQSICPHLSGFCLLLQLKRQNRQLGDTWHKPKRYPALILRAGSDCQQTPGCIEGPAGPSIFYPQAAACTSPRSG